jgi:hypothetical protein
VIFVRKQLFILVSTGLLIVLLAACGRDKEAEPTASAPIQDAAPASTQPATDAPTAAPAAQAAPEAVTTAPDTAQATAPSSDAPSGDAQQTILAAMAAQVAAGPYRATTSVDADGTITEMTAEVIPPDKMHVVIGGGNLEMILISDTLWSKSGGAAWTQMGSPDMMQSIFDSIHGQVDTGSLSNVQYVGAEPVMGVATDVYSFTSTLGGGEDVVKSDVKLWISKESGLPVRMESTGSGMGTTTHTIQSIEYDNTITIEAPAP